MNLLINKPLSQAVFLSVFPTFFSGMQKYRFSSERQVSHRFKSSQELCAPLIRARWKRDDVSDHGAPPTAFPSSYVISVLQSLEQQVCR